MPSPPGAYAKKILRKAGLEAWGRARNWTFVIGALAAAAVYFGLISNDTRTKLAWEIPVVLVIVMLLYRICVVSYQAYGDLEGVVAEKDVEIQTLMSSLADSVDHQTLADELTEQHGIGKELLNRKKDQVAWSAAEAKWIADILEIMRKHGCTKQEIHHVESVTNFDLQGTPSSLHGAMRRVFVRCERIAQISTRHAEIAEQLRPRARK